MASSLSMPSYHGGSGGTAFVAVNTALRPVSDSTTFKAAVTNRCTSSGCRITIDRHTSRPRPAWAHRCGMSMFDDRDAREHQSSRRPSFLRRAQSRRSAVAGALIRGHIRSAGVQLAGCAVAIPTVWTRVAQLAGAAAGTAAASRRWLANRSWLFHGENLVRSEAVFSGAILVLAPVLLRMWARMEAKYHDTLECRTVLQTYLIAAGGCGCAVLAAIAGMPIGALVLQMAWRAAAARSLWTWADLGRGLFERPGWLHGSVARWRLLATLVAVSGVLTRVAVMLNGSAVLQSAFSWPMLRALPRWLVAYASTPDEKLRLSASHIWLGVGMYVWVFYYLCVFLPYRMLFEDYQDYSRRAAQFNKDLTNGEARNVVLSTKIGPGFPKHLKERMARMEPGHERDILEIAGIVRQKSCSITVVKATKLKKNKEGKWGMKMTPLEPGDVSYWGSDLWNRLKQQERRDEQNGGWSPPLAPGTGMYKYNTVAYSRIMREIQAELGKTDEEMEQEIELSPLNLMRFEPGAEEGDFNLVMQQKSAIDAAGENIRMKADGHEMVVVSDEKDDGGLDRDYLNRAYLDGEEGGTLQWDGSGQLTSSDEFSYKRDDRSGQALQDSIRSAKEADK